MSFIKIHEALGNCGRDTVRRTKDRIDNILVSLLSVKIIICGFTLAIYVKEILKILLNILNEKLASLCKIIATDNGVEFVEICELEKFCLFIFLYFIQFVMWIKQKT